jgi:hypothetical protein
MVNMSMSNIGGAFKRNARSIESSARGRRAVAAAPAIRAIMNKSGKARRNTTPQRAVNSRS